MPKLYFLDPDVKSSPLEVEALTYELRSGRVLESRENLILSDLITDCFNKIWELEQIIKDRQ